MVSLFSFSKEIAIASRDEHQTDVTFYFIHYTIVAEITWVSYESTDNNQSLHCEGSSCDAGH